MVPYRHLSTLVFMGNGVCEKCITSCKNLLRIFVVNTYLRNMSENYLSSLLIEMSNASIKKSCWTELCLQRQLQQQRSCKALHCMFKYN